MAEPGAPTVDERGSTWSLKCRSLEVTITLRPSWVIVSDISWSA